MQEHRIKGQLPADLLNSKMSNIYDQVNNQHTNIYFCIHLSHLLLL